MREEKAQCEKCHLKILFSGDCPYCGHSDPDKVIDLMVAKLGEHGETYVYDRLRDQGFWKHDIDNILLIVIDAIKARGWWMQLSYDQLITRKFKAYCRVSEYGLFEHESASVALLMAYTAAVCDEELFFK